MRLLRLALGCWIAIGWLASCEGPLHEPGSDLTASPAEDRAPRSMPSELELSPRGRTAYERLLRARRFTDDAIYDGGVTPNEVIALRRLWDEEHAHEAFLRLLSDATLPGQLFALCGLYYTDRALFAERVQAYRGRPERIEFQTGCTGFVDQPVAELVELSGGVAPRLRPEESVVQWLERQEPGTRFRYDLIGGGWPNLFRAGGGWREPVDEDYAPERD